MIGENMPEQNPLKPDLPQGAEGRSAYLSGLHQCVVRFWHDGGAGRSRPSGWRCWISMTNLTSAGQFAGLALIVAGSSYVKLP